jgi:hypothetical protein
MSIGTATRNPLASVGTDSSRSSAGAVRCELPVTTAPSKPGSDCSPTNAASPGSLRQASCH